MKIETLMLLLNFSANNIKKNHPFWEKILKTIERENIKFKEWEGRYEYIKNNWRFHKNIIIDFYSYLKLNFPNAIPFSLFFPCEFGKSAGNTDDSEYHRVEKNEIYSDDKKPKTVQFDESIHYSEYGDDFDLEHDFDDDFPIIELADKWLSDILSGESFYKRNKDYFTRNEIKHFLTCDWVEPDIRLVSQYSHVDLLRHYWETKIKVNKLEMPPNFFVNKFNFIDRYDKEFFCFICRNKRYVRNENEISDIWDFLRFERENGREFDFNYMTWRQLRHMSEEWHENNQQFDYDPLRLDEMKTKVWKRSKVKDFTRTIDEKTWTITEITTGTLLYEEGNDMYNCVFSYLSECILRHCAIFSTKVNGKRMATLEIKRTNSEYELVQAQGKMNKTVDREIKSIIIIWAKENNIKINDYIFNQGRF